MLGEGGWKGRGRGFVCFVLFSFVLVFVREGVGDRESFFVLKLILHTTPFSSTE